MLSNREILGFLRLIRYRQIPWHKRSRALDTLRAYGLVEIERVPSRVNARMPEALDIAILTEEGQKELGRLECMELLPGWRRTGLLEYLGTEPPRCG
ncbi:hypothetical protein P3T24_007878 [Paraburkholderia sp. GAS33]